jgi:hypothetical protein
VCLNKKMARLRRGFSFFLKKMASGESSSSKTHQSPIMAMKQSKYAEPSTTPRLNHGNKVEKAHGDVSNHCCVRFFLFFFFFICSVSQIEFKFLFVILSFQAHPWPPGLSHICSSVIWLCSDDPSDIEQPLIPLYLNLLQITEGEAALCPSAGVCWVIDVRQPKAAVTLAYGLGSRVVVWAERLPFSILLDTAALLARFVATRLVEGAPTQLPAPGMFSPHDRASLPLLYRI